MSTRSRIGMVQPDGTIRSIYCHNDGYLSWNGKKLFMHYDTPAKVAGLIELGDISALREKLAPPKGAKHAFDNPLPDVTSAYMRDRGETDCGFQISPNVEAFLAINSGQEYSYLFENGKWAVWEKYGDAGNHRQELTLALVTERVTS